MPVVAEASFAASVSTDAFQFLFKVHSRRSRSFSFLFLVLGVLLCVSVTAKNASRRAVGRKRQHTVVCSAASLACDY